MRSPAYRKPSTTRLKLEFLEDRAVPATLDFGDAPASYGTLLAHNGASHEVAGPLLGALRDGELNSQSISPPKAMIQRRRLFGW